MDILTLLKALIMGIVEGLTEFLPISSTGHLIVLGDLLNFHSNGKVFEIAIQLGAVLAVIFEYRQRFTSVLSGLGKDRTANRFVLNLAVAFVPAAVVGLLFSKQIKEYLFNEYIPVFGDWEDNLLMLRYDAEVLVHDYEK